MKVVGEWSIWKGNEIALDGDDEVEVDLGFVSLFKLFYSRIIRIFHFYL